jgi:DNA-binding MarR family transcriptional regulator
MPRKNLNESVAELMNSVGLLVRRVRVAGATGDLSMSESAVMSRLSKDGPASIADLARAESVKPQSMGTMIATLEEMGLVERKPHPSDGRQSRIALTAKGEAVRKTTKDAKVSWLAQGVAALDENERETLFAAGEIIKKLAGL